VDFIAHRRRLIAHHTDCHSLDLWKLFNIVAYPFDPRVAFESRKSSARRPISNPGAGSAPRRSALGACSRSRIAVTPIAAVADERGRGPTALGELFRERRHYPRPGSGEWMPAASCCFEIELRPVDGASAACGPSSCAVFLRFPGFQGAQHLRGERFVIS